MIKYVLSGFAFFLTLAVMAFIGWCAGLSFEVRGLGLGLTAACSFMVAGCSAFLVLRK